MVAPTFVLLLLAAAAGNHAGERWLGDPKAIGSPQGTADEALACSLELPRRPATPAAPAAPAASTPPACSCCSAGGRADGVHAAAFTAGRRAAERLGQRRHKPSAAQHSRQGLGRAPRRRAASALRRRGHASPPPHNVVLSLTNRFSLPQEVDQLRVFPDSKTIVDMPLTAPPAEVAAAFNALQLPADPVARNETVTDFVNKARAPSARIPETGVAVATRLGPPPAPHLPHASQWLTPPGSDLVNASAELLNKPAPAWFQVQQGWGPAGS